MGSINYSSASSPHASTIPQCFELIKRDPVYQLVYLIDRQTGAQYLLKQQFLNPSDQRNLHNLKKLWDRKKQLVHPHVTSLKDYVFHDSLNDTNPVQQIVARTALSEIYASKPPIGLALYNYPHRSLRQLMKQREQKNNAFTENELWRILTECISGFAYLCHNDICHGCVRSDNIYVQKVPDPKQEWKIIVPDPYIKSVESNSQLIQSNTKIGIQGVYLSPAELENNSKHVSQFKSDVFALGIVILELAFLSPLDSVLYDSKRTLLNQTSLQKHIELLGQKYGAQLKSLVTLMTETNQNQRLGWQELEKLASNSSPVPVLIPKNQRPSHTINYEKKNSTKRSSVQTNEGNKATGTTPSRIRPSFGPVPDRIFIPEMNRMSKNSSYIQQDSNLARKDSNNRGGQGSSRNSIAKPNFQRLAHNRHTMSPERLGQGSQFLRTKEGMANKSFLNMDYNINLSKLQHIDPEQTNLVKNSSYVTERLNKMVLKTEMRDQTPNHRKKRLSSHANELSFERLGAPASSPTPTPQIMVIPLMQPSQQDRVNDTKGIPKPVYILKTHPLSNLIDSDQEEVLIVDYDQQRQLQSPSNPIAKAQQLHRLQQRQVDSQSSFGFRVNAKTTKRYTIQQKPTSAQYGMANNKSHLRNSPGNNHTENNLSFYPSNLQCLPTKGHGSMVDGKDPTHYYSLYTNQQDARTVRIVQSRFEKTEVGRDTHPNMHKKIVVPVNDRPLITNMPRNADYPIGVGRASPMKTSFAIDTPNTNENNMPVFVKQSLKQGAHYEGWKLKGMRHGKGKFYYVNGGMYDGDWCLNRMEGQGILYYPTSKLAYEGTWHQDKFHGYGKQYNQKPESKSKINYQDFGSLDDNWTYYEGSFYQDLKQGNGTLHFTNGDTYEGQFKKDLIHGQGIYTTSKGLEIRGRWEKNVLVQRYA